MVLRRILSSNVGLIKIRMLTKFNTGRGTINVLVLEISLNDFLLNKGEDRRSRRRLIFYQTPPKLANLNSSLLPLHEHRHDDVDIVIHPHRADNARA